jgi:hypothetical protein
MSKQEYYRRRKLVQAISPEDKLRYLNSYMKLWVKKYPMPAWYTFDKFLEMLVAEQLKAKAYYGERTGGKCRPAFPATNGRPTAACTNGSRRSPCCMKPRPPA